MLLLELLVILLLVAFAANGVRAGAVETLGRLIGAILGFVAARAWSAWPVAALSTLMPLSWAYLASFIAIFLLVDNFVGFFFKLANQILKVVTRLPLIKQVDGLIGGIIGFLEGIIVMGGVAFLLRQAALSSGVAQSVIQLKSIMTIEQGFRFMLGFLL